jgi:hypothetical protein
VIGNGNHIRLAQVGGIDDLFEIAVCDLVSLLEALGVALALGGVLIPCWRESVRENSCPASNDMRMVREEAVVFDSA